MIENGWFGFLTVYENSAILDVFIHPLSTVYADEPIVLVQVLPLQCDPDQLGTTNVTTAWTNG